MEGHATASRKGHLQIPLHKSRPTKQTPVYGTEINELQDGENPYLLEADNLLNRAVGKFGLKQKLKWIDSHFFHPNAWFSWSAPHSYQIPGRYYSITSPCKPEGDKKPVLRHRDAFRREHEGLEEDQYLHPLNGKVQKLVVQSTKATYNQGNNTTWRRTYMRNVSPYIVRLAYWPLSSVPPSKETSASAGGYGHERTSAVTDEDSSCEVTALSSWKKEQWMYVSLRWLPTCIGLLIMVRQMLLAIYGGRFS
jgi:hypothetical protein